MTHAEMKEKFLVGMPRTTRLSLRSPDGGIPVTRAPARRTNWAGNIAYRAARHHRPTSVDELQELLSVSRAVRPVGTGHSFNRLADTDGDQVSVAGLPHLLEVDPDERQVTIAAGMRYGEVAGPLHDRGWALANLGSLPHISVAGAVATGTHGSGERNGGLATAVRALQMVVPGGELVTLDRDRDGDTFTAPSSRLVRWELSPA